MVATPKSFFLIAPGPTLALVCLPDHVVDHPPPRRQQRRERRDPLGLLAQPGAGHGRVSQNISIGIIKSMDKI